MDTARAYASSAVLGNGSVLVVGGIGVPHTPYYPSLVEREGPGCDTARFFASLTAELEAMRRERPAARD